MTGGPYEGWYDADAGPLVRPYAMTGGRTRPSSEAFDLIAIVSVSDILEDIEEPAMVLLEAASLAPEHATILDLCRLPLSVAEIASALDLPVAVVRILLSDLLERGLIEVRRPAPITQLPHEGILKEVIDGLRAL